MSKALVVYGTRYGATAKTSNEVADILNQEGWNVRVVNIKEEKVKDITEYDLVVVGSGIKMGKWTKEPEIFLEKFQKELVRKKVALFVCCGSKQPIEEKEDKTTTIKIATTKYLEEKATKYNLQPIALGLFGGVYNFNKMSWFFRKTMSSIKPKLEKAGFKEIELGLYDTRDLKTIRSWAKEVSQMG